MFETRAIVWPRDRVPEHYALPCTVDAFDTDYVSYTAYLGDHLYVQQKIEAIYGDTGQIVAHRVTLEVAYVTPESYDVLATYSVNLAYNLSE
jgi:hypothetical protein